MTGPWWEPGTIPEKDSVRRLNKVLLDLKGRLGRDPVYNATTNVAADYTVTEADQHIRVDSTSAAVDVTLPDPKANLGRSWVVKWVAGANTVTVKGEIDGSTDHVVATLLDFHEFLAVETGANTYGYDLR